MTSSQPRDSVIPPPPRLKKSFLSRLKSPLSSKSRNFTDFHIQSDDPHRQYTPGDIISGTVVIKVVKPLRITHLVVSLHGYAQVFKNPNAPGDGYKTYSATVGSGEGKRSGSYFGNGFASLFEDEVVLCGEGRLSEGVYHFNFELEFPSKGLPSSIDFERGTVAYMLTATLTRPTAISPTSSCDSKVQFTDTVDIAPIPEPKQRVISLEPISKRSRAKSSRKRPTTAVPNEPPQTSNGTEASQNRPVSRADAPSEENRGPRSPSPSDVSFESQMSSSNASGTEYGVRTVNTNDGLSVANGSRATSKGKTITATIDVLKGGFLRGDQVTVRIKVDHTKHIRSLKGIIVTLYRQARVDMHPALPVASNGKNDKVKSEDYYPKSRTGLGGLSLSSAGSSHLFRKDLCQSFAPLFIDPRTLTAEVKCSVRVPDEAFPTISNVPGAMISFNYYIEVVIDIQGKLVGLDRMITNAGIVNVSSGPVGASGTARDDTANNMFSTWGGNFVDTDQIRREKGVISSLFEVIIGTKDSDRNGKKKQAQKPIAEEPSNVHEPEGYDQDYYGYDENGQYYDYDYDPAYYDIPGYDHNESRAATAYNAPSGPAGGEQGLSEKEHLRRAEASLLPSQPPETAGPSSPSVGVRHDVPASAPLLPEDDDPNPPYFPPESSSSALAHPPPPFRSTTSPASSPYMTTVPSTRQRATDDELRTTTTNSSTTINDYPRPSQPQLSRTTSASKPLPPLPPQSPSAAPEYFSSPSLHVQPTDDKQELQRRRLKMEASAPPDDHDDEGESSRAPAQRIQVPSAPILDEDDEGLVDGMPGRRARISPDDRRKSEALPEYQR
ncbi:hypothetical protein P153DRAFT_372679 [Dothidotthia symphoricarpi CBS 119687]|uniref:Arrestin C-terminal-like domain-containing protein n=1 Tax=Dothidotthia symphoricarpi CBS 119687 TaxID=1392245 RepID=A0A6A6AR01_9PLEO|nr:uncharacterized protein P153DRAFT_372679 [Dothidotthia symphoricarpi CBS 119687]KAF2134230.1 hypothetical protein P153DRAFT_372679 [Dothidotthia symphoricarpi CBS 119687]